MSLYGEVRKLASQQFQFDRVYPSRKAMDDALENHLDGVHHGRYVLVEYGERYEQAKDENGELLWETIRTSNSDGSLNERQVQKWAETETYAESAEIDKQIYGINYDSTVWQKIYVTTFQKNEDGSYKHDALDNLIPEKSEKFIMIAELNAAIPKLDLTAEKNQVYFPVESDEEAEDDLYDKNNHKIEHTASEIIRPYFDSFVDTELTYLLHYPTPLKLNVQSNAINYHLTGFDIVYKHPKSTDNPEEDDTNYIRWLTDDYDIQQNLGQKVQVGEKTLKMNLPAFGDAMSDLYDLIYGEPANEEVTINGQTYIDTIRPYFKPFRDKEKYKYIVDVTNPQNDPDNLVYKIENGNQIFRTPENDWDGDQYYWLRDVPYIGDILANNSLGFVHILKSLFAQYDPYAEKYKYWFVNDWTAEEFSENSNQPTIMNKPEVVTYLSETEYQDLEELFKSHDEIKPVRKMWLTGTNSEKDESIGLELKIPYTNQGESISPPIVIKNPTTDEPYQENYEYYKVTQNENEVPIELGHWFLDRLVWVLRHIPFINKLVDAFYKGNLLCENGCESGCNNECSSCTDGIVFMFL